MPTISQLTPIGDAHPRSLFERAAHLWRLAKSEGAGIFLFIPLLMTMAALCFRIGFADELERRTKTKRLIENLLAANVEPMHGEEHPTMVAAAVSLAGAAPQQVNDSPAADATRKVVTRLAGRMVCVSDALMALPDDPPSLSRAKACFSGYVEPLRTEAAKEIDAIAKVLESAPSTVLGAISEVLGTKASRSRWLNAAAGPVPEVKRCTFSDQTTQEKLYGSAACEATPALSNLLVPAPLNRCPEEASPCFSPLDRLAIHYSRLFEMTIADQVPTEPVKQAFYISSEGLVRMWSLRPKSPIEFNDEMSAIRRWNAGGLYRRFFEGSKEVVETSRAYIDQARLGIVATVCTGVKLGHRPLAVVCGDFQVGSMASISSEAPGNGEAEPSAGPVRELAQDHLLLAGAAELSLVNGRVQLAIDKDGTLFDGSAGWSKGDRQRVADGLEQQLSASSAGSGNLKSMLTTVNKLIEPNSLETVYMLPLQLIEGASDKWRVLFLRALFPDPFPTAFVLAAGLFGICLMLAAQGVGQRLTRDQLRRDDAILRHLQAGVVQSNERGFLEYGNDRAEEILGVALPNPGLPRELRPPRQRWADLIHHEVIPKPDLDRIVTVQEVETWRKEGRRRGYYARLRGPDAPGTWIEVRATPFLTAGTRTHQPSFGIITTVPKDRCERLDELVRVIRVANQPTSGDAAARERSGS
jgi:PAS domain-containing protein